MLQGLVERSYGGVKLGDANISSYRFRQHSMKTVKNAISKKAAELVENPGISGGEMARNSLKHFNIDIAFFRPTPLILKGK